MLDDVLSVDGSDALLFNASVHPLESKHISSTWVNAPFLEPAGIDPPDPGDPHVTLNSRDVRTALDAGLTVWYHTEALGQTFRHSGWRRDRQQRFEAMKRVGLPAYRRQAFAECGEHVRLYESSDTPGTFKLAGSYCHDRLCTPCATSRAFVIRTNLCDHVRNKSVRFLTLTIAANASGLGERTDHIVRSFAQLRTGDAWKRHVVGGAYFIEFKYSWDHKSWHVHIHALIEGRYFPHALLKQAWKQASGDSEIVDIRPAGSNDSIAKYVTKYVTKPIDHEVVHDDSLLDEAIVALKGRRLCTTIGSWRGTALTKPPATGNWTDAGRLEDFLDRVLDGDDDAFAALVSAGITDVLRYAELRRPQWRKPPPPVADAPRQLLLFDAETRCYAPVLWGGRPPHAPEIHTQTETEQ